MLNQVEGPLEALRAWAPLPLRLALGVGLIQHGGIKLFAPGGHANIAHLVAELGVPAPDVMGWIVGLVEFVGGLGMLVGAFTPVAAGINALNVAGLSSWQPSGAASRIPCRAVTRCPVFARLS
jgi:putative oxidoreductase